VSGASGSRESDTSSRGLSVGCEVIGMGIAAAIRCTIAGNRLILGSDHLGWPVSDLGRVVVLVCDK